MLVRPGFFLLGHVRLDPVDPELRNVRHEVADARSTQEPFSWCLAADPPNRMDSLVVIALKVQVWLARIVALDVFALNLLIPRLGRQ